MRTIEERRALGLDYPGVLYPPFSFEAPVMLTYRVEVQANVTIGAHSYMNGGMICRQTRIGRYCSLAYGLSLGVSSHSTWLASTHPFTNGAAHDPEFENPYWKDVKWRDFTEIGHDVWIAQDAIVLQGVKIGTGAVVASNAVVTNDVAPYEVVGGTPARTISRRFSNNLEWIDGLLSSRWWECPYEVLRTFPMNNIPVFIERATEYIKLYGVHHYATVNLVESFPLAV